jgi:hypothetical protein
MKPGGSARGRDNMRSELPFGFILGKGADLRRPHCGVTHSESLDVEKRMSLSYRAAPA